MITDARKYAHTHSLKTECLRCRSNGGRGINTWENTTT